MHWRRGQDLKMFVQGGLKEDKRRWLNLYSRQGMNPNGSHYPKSTVKRTQCGRQDKGTDQELSVEDCIELSF